MNRILLASQSEIRKRGLDILGLKYETHPSFFDEKSIRNDNPYLLAKLLSEAKAKTIGNLNPDAIVVASDAFMVFKGKIIEKPMSIEEAFQMLRNFSGEEYDFLTGLAVYNGSNGQMLSTVESCRIKWRSITDEEIHDYIGRYPVLKFAGAHDMDGVLRFSEHISGNYNFGAALPINVLVEFLKANQVSV